ncbi:Alpha/gamma-adaptin-binding protein p34 [Penicillium herquei]|nr:Alpha/gamma-adaptin-binding protein p34 [Penicillium herquei]
MDSTGPEPSKAQGKQITNPRRLLILSPPTQSLSIIPPLLHSLTGVPVLNPPQKDEPDISSPSSPPESANSDTDTPHTPPSTSFAGYTTHSPLRLETKYYSAEIPVWVDEVPLPLNSSTASSNESTTQWRTEFLSDEAEIVRDAVGALVVAVQDPREVDPSAGATPSSRTDVRGLLELMRDIGAVKERIDEERGGMGDVPGVFILVGASKSAPPDSGYPSTNTGHRDHDELALGDEDGLEGIEDLPLSVGWWEDQLFDCGLVGWEVVEWDPKMQGGEKTKNKFGEYEGMPRIKEVLETHDWTASGGSNDLDGQDLEFDFEDDDLESELLGYSRSAQTRGFGHEVQELEREMLGLRMAIERGGDDDGFEDEEEIKVESMEALMMRVQGIRDMGADLPENERKKFAAKAVNDLMREL